MKKASIIGIGDISEGDLGIGCYILEALAREPLDDSVQLAYLGDDPRYAGGLLYGADVAIIVGALNMGGQAGSLHCWNYSIFRQHVEWIINESRSIGLLVDALARTELAGGFPGDLLSLWIEPQVTEGFEISRQVRKAMWKAVRVIKKHLSERGFLPEGALEILPIFRLEPFGTVA